MWRNTRNISPAYSSQLTGRSKLSALWRMARYVQQRIGKQCIHQEKESLLIQAISYGCLTWVTLVLKANISFRKRKSSTYFGIGSSLEGAFN